MKRKLQILLLLISMSISARLSAQRYLTEIFTGVNVTQNVMFGQNIIPPFIVQGAVDTLPLLADIYEPVGDVLPARATVIVIHTGSFLPIFYNGQPTGSKTDSAVAEICRRFARRGFTAISMEYRYGWNPTASDQEIRTGTILQAAGRGVQDTKACVRYFRNNALTTNDYHIDESKIILGGIGTGGYIALAYATIQGVADYSIPGKFLSTQNNPSYGFTSGVTYFDPNVWGDIDGYGGIYNISTNTPGVSNAISFVFNCGGALADSSWLRPGNVPMVCFHPVNDPFAPYNIGWVIVPTTGQLVVEVSGSHPVIQKADLLQNNWAFQNNTWTDPYTTVANSLNGGDDGLYPFILPDPGPPFHGQAGPWEYWDSTTVQYICQNLLGWTVGKVDTMLANSLLTNPDMSHAKSMAYIDTIMGYLCPRMFPVITSSTNDISDIQKDVKIYPNPTSDFINVNVSDNKMPVRAIDLCDISGRLVYTQNNINKQSIKLDLNLLKTGIYFMKIKFDKGEVNSKVIKQ